ncbi:MAG: Hsp20/alpha crystallin family protein [Candidatus Falkowbacteria bacterium]
MIKWTPFIDTFEEMDKNFNAFLPSLHGSESLVPAVDVYEDKDNVIVEAQLAGIDPDKVDISIEHDTLLIRGESEKKSEVDEKNYYRKEIRRGSFYRSILLPTHVSGDKAEAVATDGVLKITIPKTTNQSKQIKVKTVKK